MATISLVVLSGSSQGSSALGNQQTDTQHPPPPSTLHRDCPNYEPSDQTSFLLSCQRPQKVRKSQNTRVGYFGTSVSALILLLVRYVCLLHGRQSLHCCKLCSLGFMNGKKFLQFQRNKKEARKFLNEFEWAAMNALNRLKPPHILYDITT